MKYFLLGLFFVFSYSALACRGTEICQGKKVIPDTYSKGYARVVAINRSTKKITVKGNLSSKYHRFYRRDLAVTDGCLRGVCVGHKVIPDSYEKGYARVQAINQYSKKYVLKGNLSTKYGRNYKRSLALTKGCLRGICVGDKVFPDTYRKGYARVMAINPHTKKFTVKGNISSKYHRFYARRISLLEECLDYSMDERDNYEF